jgi:hypothetical protein
MHTYIGRSSKKANESMGLHDQTFQVPLHHTRLDNRNTYVAVNTSRL